MCGGGGEGGGFILIYIYFFLLRSAAGACRCRSIQPLSSEPISRDEHRRSNDPKTRCCTYTDLWYNYNEGVCANGPHRAQTVLLYAWLYGYGTSEIPVQQYGRGNVYYARETGGGKRKVNKTKKKKKQKHLLCTPMAFKCVRRELSLVQTVAYVRARIHMRG